MRVVYMVEWKDILTDKWTSEKFDTEKEAEDLLSELRSDPNVYVHGPYKCTYGGIRNE